MRKLLRTGFARRTGLAVILAIGCSSAALAFGIVPGTWKVLEGGKTLVPRVSKLQFAIITNKGPDSILVTAKGTTKVATGEILGGDKATVIVPKGCKKVKLADGIIGNSMGSKGTLIWSQKVSVTGQIIDVKPKQ